MKDILLVMLIMDGLKILHDKVNDKVLMIKIKIKNKK